eukprot:COSAG02_NODE_62840_length_264_cov_5.466667_1_plen_24_part_01
MTSLAPYVSTLWCGRQVRDRGDGE